MNGSYRPECWIIAGPNGAGKTTFAMDYLPRIAKCHNFVNADLIAAGLSPLEPESKAFAAGRTFLHEISKNILEQRNFGFETTLSGLNYRKLIKDLRSTGWKVQMIYLALPASEMAALRVAERVRHGGHNIPYDDIVRRFFRSLVNLFDEYIQLPDQVFCYCNADSQPKLIFTQRDSRRTVTNGKLLKKLEILRQHGL